MIFINKLDRYGSDPFLARILRYCAFMTHDHEQSVTEVDDVDVVDVDVDLDVDVESMLLALFFVV